MAFLSKANVPTSEKREQGVPGAAPSSFPWCSPLGWLVFAQPWAQLAHAEASAHTWALRRSRPGGQDVCLCGDREA